MKYTSTQTDHVAAEYVLGTLHGPARRRFERLMIDRADVRLAVWTWERRLGDLVLGLTPCQPPRHVWKSILKRISPRATDAASVFERLRGFWLALPATAAMVWMLVVLLPVTSVERLAVIADQNSDPLWVISADLDVGTLEARTINAPDIAADADYELWVLTADGPPLSLGILNRGAGSIETQIPAKLVEALSRSQRLAISLEPAGGSPTGLPTGPIVYQASLLTI